MEMVAQLERGKQISQVQTNPVQVKVLGFDELRQLDYSLQLDNYQRPYVWGKDKVGQLLDDLNAFTGQSEQTDYYLGTLLLHRQCAKKALFVIDGQQRLSTLAVLHHALHQTMPDRLDFHYRSPRSVVNLQGAKQLMTSQRLALLQDVFQRLRFTVIIVDREDLAFTFFDTQNNRGVPLAATDLLKAYHLRAIGGERGEALQAECARLWEGVQQSGKARRGRSDFAPKLFNRYLWRARNWRGSHHIELEQHDGLLETFQQQSLKSEEENSIPLYPGRHNQFATRLTMQESDNYQLELNPVRIGSHAARLPFSLRQPIHQGVGFFLYTQKYAALIDELWHQPTNCFEVKTLRCFYQRVVLSNAGYLRELFDLALLMYVDQFGEERMVEFALAFELVLCGIRLEKRSVYDSTPRKYLREADHNLLDIIAGAYRPEEVLVVLQGQQKWLINSSRLLESITRGQGVRGRYLSAWVNYLDDEKWQAIALPPEFEQLLNQYRNKESTHA
ncbi:DUF262 domain-containing protein [uncultured Oceanisphaera sp.]|uniref:DUF262 domain-containing protein n=1 Tax=uncultured Oceanisphaera sp. TaxID=353858 RepID=UPI00260546D6|nr:DUF262 domain-containing protein [uncultured Oceanisphaera sp.]